MFLLFTPIESNLAMEAVVFPFSTTRRTVLLDHFLNSKTSSKKFLN